MGWVGGVVLVLLLSGCVSLSSLDGMPIPADARGATFVVQHQPADGRGLDETIVSALRAHGLEALSGRYADAESEFVVTYIDRWYWDMRTYLIDLRIDVREADTGKLVATARSYQSSLAAMGNRYREIVRKVVDVLALGLEAVAPAEPKEAKKTRGRRRR